MSLTIALAGDTMLGRGVGDEITATGPENLFSGEVRDCIASADLTVVNLECCISARGSPWDSPGKLFHFRAPPQAAAALARLGVNCVTLANNHTLDFGYTAFADTLGHLSATGIAVTGAGTNLEHARSPAILQAAGLRVAILGITDHPSDFAATADNPGAAYAHLAGGVPAWLTDQVAALAEANVAVVVMPHWGPNMTLGPLPYIRRAARALTQAGATLVAGTSAHLFHGIAGQVLFDLGDFIDDYATDPDLRNDLGLLFLVTLDGQRMGRVEAVPLKLRYARTELAAIADRAWIRDRFTRACATFGTSVHDRNGRLVAQPGPGPEPGPRPRGL